MVTIHSGVSVLVVVNVHFDRSLRGRLRLITPHWPCYPGALGVTGDFTVGDVGRLPCSGPFSRTSLKSHSLTSQVKIPQPMVQYALCPELTGHSSISLWLRHVIFTAILMSLRTLVNVPSRVTAQQGVSSYRNRQIGASRSNVSRVGCRNIPVSGPF